MHSPTYQSGDTKLLGAVQTVQFELNEEKGKKSEIKGHYVSQTSSRLGSSLQIDQTRPDTILLLNGPPGISNAIYGGIMSARIKHLGALGVVVSGRFRDLQEQRDLKWPVWARGVGTTAGGEVCFPSAIDVPLKVESWVDGTKHTSNVNPGDIIMADQDGVVCIPAGLAEQVADLVPKLAAVDQKCLEDVKNGRSVTEAFGEHRGRLKC